MRNIMLINMQNPGATRVDSYSLWKEKFNRQVKKGEEGIRIFAPVKDKEPEKKLMEKIDPETGAPLLDKNGKVILEEMTALTSGVRFKLSKSYLSNHLKMIADRAGVKAIRVHDLRHSHVC